MCKVKSVYLVEGTFLGEVSAHIHLCSGLLVIRLALELHDQGKVLLKPRETRSDLHIMSKFLLNTIKT